MQTEILIAIIVSIMVWGYHRSEYKKTKYEKFQYYLDGEVNYFIKSWIEIFQVMAILFITVAVMVGIYELSKYLLGNFGVTI